MSTEGGWLSKDMVEIFAKYAETCFLHFGKRVKHWITFNEPFCVVHYGYGVGNSPPGKKIVIVHVVHTLQGKSSDQFSYRAAHNILLAHSRAVEIYRYDGMHHVSNFPGNLTLMGKLELCSIAHGESPKLNR